jgi:hypothetical protein
VGYSREPLHDLRRAQLGTFAHLHAGQRRFKWASLALSHDSGAAFNTYNLDTGGARKVLDIDAVTLLPAHFPLEVQ